MRNIILAVGMFMIILVAFCAVDKENIKYHLIANSINRKYGTTIENNYYLDDNFDYVNNNTDAKITSYHDLIHSIYYTINSGTNYTEKYCDIKYKNCIADLERIASNEDLLSSFNNFAHPYNNFETMKFSHNDKTFSLEINHTYTTEDINKLNDIVDKVINEKITNNMTTREKIKVIHNYIIDNTDYDTLKSDNINDSTYRSNTAYGVLVENKGICSGYSDAMAIFLNRLNVINYKISNEEHIWNFVYIDGNWYHLDLTWDDPISTNNITRDSYFLITTNDLEYLNDKTHTFDKAIYSEAK